MPSKKAQTFNLEKSLNKLNQLVEKMERGNLPLEESLKNFEQGISLIRECQKTLINAEQKVKVLIKDNGEEKLQPFQADNADDD